MEITLVVQRFDPDVDTATRKQSYQFEIDGDATLLDAMRKVQEEQDPSLAFRGHCATGLCGDCAMRAAGESVLACCTTMTALTKKGPEVPVVPIRNMPILKDMVYDMEKFLFAKVKAVQPWLSDGDAPREEYIVADKDLEEVRRSIECVMCGLCDEGCVVINVDDSYLGPAAITKGFRFTYDPRDHNLGERLALLDGKGGVWDCASCFEANGHCPKNLRPTDKVLEVREQSIRHGIQNPGAARHYNSFAASVESSGWLDEGRLALESEGLTNIPGLLRLAPTAIRAIRKGKAPLPYLHHKRPGADQIRRIFQKARAKEIK